MDNLLEIIYTVIIVLKKWKHELYIETDQFMQEVPQRLSDWVPQGLYEEYTLTILAVQSPLTTPAFT